MNPILHLLHWLRTRRARQEHVRRLTIARYGVWEAIHARIAPRQHFAHLEWWDAHRVAYRPRQLKVYGCE